MTAQNFLNPYIYDPSYPLAITGAILVLLVSAYSLYQYIRLKAYFFWAAIIAIVMLQDAVVLSQIHHRHFCVL